MTDQRRRETRYPEQVAVRISTGLRDRLEALADRDMVSLGIVLRRTLEAGLPLVEAQGSEQSAMAQARDWWSGLDNDRRTDWQKRLPGRKGRELIAEAWRQTHGL